jgi:hypothetical protein
MALNFPATPDDGDIYEGYVWNDTVGAWQSTQTGGGSIDASPTPPVSPNPGDLWWDTDDGKLYIYYDDGTSEQWVDAAGPSVAVQGTAPTGYQGQLWLDSTDGSMYVYYTDPGGVNSQWIGAVSRSGGILQVVQTEKSDTFTASLSAGALSTEVTGFTASITPRSTSSKILVEVVAQVSNSQNVKGANIILFKNGVALDAARGDAAGSRVRVSAGSNNSNSVLTTVSISFLDSPATTSSTTYSIVMHNGDGSASILYLNRTGSDTDTTQFPRAMSTITLMEVAG